MSSNIFIVYLGGILGIVAMRFVAGVFLKLLDRFQGLEVAAYLLVAWIGLRSTLFVEAACATAVTIPLLLSPVRRLRDVEDATVLASAATVV